MKVLAMLTVALIISPAAAQTVEQLEEETGEQIFLTSTIAIPAEPPGYTLVLPDDGPVRGMIVFFNADRDTASKLFRYSIPLGIAVLSVTTGADRDDRQGVSAGRSAPSAFLEYCRRSGRRQLGSSLIHTAEPVE